MEFIKLLKSVAQFAHVESSDRILLGKIDDMMVELYGRPVSVMDGAPRVSLADPDHLEYETETIRKFEFCFVNSPRMIHHGLVSASIETRSLLLDINPNPLAAALIDRWFNDRTVIRIKLTIPTTEKIALELTGTIESYSRGTIPLDAEASIPCDLSIVLRDRKIEIVR